MYYTKVLILALILACVSSDVALAQNGTARTVTPTVLNVSQVVLGANKRRQGFTIHNRSANSVYLTFGPTSSGATCTRIMGADSNFDMFGPAMYRGEISAIRNGAGSGLLIITEFMETNQ